MPLRIACDALERGVCLDLRYRGELLCVEVHAAGYGRDAVPLLYCWQRVGITGGGWRLVRIAEAQGIGDSGYFSEAPRPGYSLDGAISRIVCQV
jgi:hypothetical protein